jgi:hypothetical protein
MPRVAFKTTVAAERLRRTRFRTRQDFVEAEEEYDDLRQLLRALLKNKDGKPCVGWCQYVYNRVKVTGVPVLLKGEDPDKAVCTFQCGKLRKLCEHINGTPKGALDNPALVMPSISAGPIRAEETFKTNEKHLDLFAFWLQQFDIVPQVSIEQIATFVRMLSSLGYRGWNNYWSTTLRECEACRFILPHNPHEKLRIHLAIIKSITDSDPSKARPWSGELMPDLSLVECNLIVFWSLLGLRFHSFCALENADIREGQFCNEFGVLEKCIVIESQVQKVQKQTGRRLYVPCNCKVASDAHGHIVKCPEDCFVCPGGREVPNMNLQTRASVASTLRRAKIARHGLKRYFIFKLYWMYNRLEQSPGILAAVAWATGWEPGSIMLQKYTSDHHKFPPETVGSRNFSGPARMVTVVAKFDEVKIRIPNLAPRLIIALKNVNALVSSPRKKKRKIDSPTGACEKPLPSTKKLGTRKAKAIPKSVAAHRSGLQPLKLGNIN